MARFICELGGMPMVIDMTGDSHSLSTRCDIQNADLGKMFIAGMQTRDGGFSNTVGMQGFVFDVLLAFLGMAEFLVSNHREC
jgi:hypothetical protein